MSTVPEGAQMSTVPEARKTSTVPEARKTSTVPEARQVNTVAPGAEPGPDGLPRCPLEPGQPRVSSPITMKSGAVRSATTTGMFERLSLEGVPVRTVPG